MFVRIIPRLDIKGPNLVKGIHLEGLRVLGLPQQFAKHYYKNGADELIYVDIVASLYERNSLQDIIEKTAKEIFIPLTVGGGIRTIDDIRSILRSGADKVSINTAAVKNPTLISEAANIFGSSTIVVSIETIKNSSGKYYAFTDNGREKTDLEVISWAKKIEKLGAGEIVLTSVDREGTGEGFDNDLNFLVTKAVDIPVVAHGGAGKSKDIVDAFKVGGVQAVACSSIFHYDFMEKHTVKTNLTEGSASFIKSGKSYNRVKVDSIRRVKQNLTKNKVKCRI